MSSTTCVILISRTDRKCKCIFVHVFLKQIRHKGLSLCYCFLVCFFFHFPPFMNTWACTVPNILNNVVRYTAWYQEPLITKETLTKSSCVTSNALAGGLTLLRIVQFAETVIVKVRDSYLNGSTEVKNQIKDIKFIAVQISIVFH